MIRKWTMAVAFLALGAGCSSKPAESPKQAEDERKAARDERRAAEDERKAAADERKAEKEEHKAEKEEHKAEAEEKKAEAAAKPTPGYRWEVSSAAGMKLEVPNEWVTEAQGNVLLVRTPTPGVGIEFVSATSKLAAEKDEKALVTELLKTLKNVKVKGGLKDVEQHGLKGFVASGTGEKKGAAIDWFTAALSNGKTGVLAVGFWAPKTSDKYKEEMKHILDSIQPGT
jgi:hypothetical protein